MSETTIYCGAIDARAELSMEDLPGEQWRDVVGYDGYYEVSNMGRVKALPRLVPNLHGGLSLRKGRILKPQITRVSKKTIRQILSPQYHVGLCVANCMKTYRVDRLVAHAWLPAPTDPEAVNIVHLDGNHFDNRPHNLKWVSVSEAQKMRYTVGRDDRWRIVRQRINMMNAIPIRVLFLGKPIMDFESVADCADWLITNELVRTKKKRNAISNIGRWLRAGTHRKFYGMHFELLIPWEEAMRRWKSSFPFEGLTLGPRKHRGPAHPAIIEEAERTQLEARGS